MKDYPTLHFDTNLRNGAFIKFFAFHSHSGVFDNEHNSYPTMSEKHITRKYMLE